MKNRKHIIILVLFSLFFSFSFNSFSQNNDEFEPINDDEFQQVDEFDEFQDTDEFDEFQDTEEFDEFEGGDGEFEDISADEETKKVSYNRMWWAIFILLATIIAGVLVQFKTTRKLRGIFLIASVVILGFYRGGPGVISSFQNAFLWFAGIDNNWQAAILFLGLIPITYVFGKVFCGWICYLGALQEFLYIKKVKIFQTEKAQKIMRIIRIVLLVVLIAQLSITREILWNKIGPFKTAFNLFSPNLTGYILLGILLVSSLFIHRPFCKTVCPVGLIDGWISKIPGASILGINNSCAGCNTCNTACQINAITREGKTSKLDNQECIRCGDCMDDCRIKSISFYKKGKKHNDKIILKGVKKLNIK